MAFSTHASILLLASILNLTFVVDAGIRGPTYTESELQFQSSCQSGNLYHVQRVAAEMGSSFIINYSWGSQGWYYTCLSVACTAGHEKLVNYLLQNGDDPNEQPGNRMSVMFLAYEKKHFAIVKELLDAGARANGQHSGMHEPTFYPIFWAVLDNNLKTAQMFIEAGAVVNVIGENGYTPIQKALMMGYHDMARLLQKAGAYWAPKYPTESDLQLQSYCLSGSLSDVQQVAEEKGASFVVDYSWWSVGDSYTCLSVACTAGHVELANYLLKNGDDPNETTYHVGIGYWSVMFLAYDGKHFSIVKNLLEAGAHYSMDTPDPKDYGLFWAVNDGNLEVTKMFIDAGADVNMTSAYHNDTLVQRALKSGHLDMANFLLEAGAYWACAGKRHGERVVNPNDCCGYIECMLRDGTHMEIEEELLCPPLKTWNERTQLCEAWKAVDCGNRNDDCIQNKY